LFKKKIIQTSAKLSGKIGVLSLINVGVIDSAIFLWVSVTESVDHFHGLAVLFL